MTPSIFPSSLSVNGNVFCEAWENMESTKNLVFVQHSELIQKDHGTPPKKKVLFKCGLLSTIKSVPTSATTPPCFGELAHLQPGSFVLQVGGANVYTLPMLPALAPLAIVLAPILSGQSPNVTNGIICYDMGLFENRVTKTTIC